MSFKEDQQAKLNAIVGDKKGKARDDVLANVVKSSKRTFQSGTPENKKMKKEIEDYKKLDMLPPPPLVVQSTGESNMYINKTASVMEDKQSREIDRNITNAGFGQKSLAVASAFAQGSSVGNAINKFYELNMTEESRNVDKEFKSSINTTFLQDYMAVHGIPNKEKYFELLLGANNKEHLAKISDFIQTDMYMEQTISNSITPLANVSARFVGEMTTHPLSAIATLPTVIPRAMVMAKGAQSTLATLGSSVGISYIGMKATEYGDPSTTSDDFYLGLGVGALADLASTKIMYNKYKAQDNFRDMVEKNIRMSVEATNRTDEAMKYFNPNKHDITTNYKWSVAKENVAKQEASLASDAVQAEKTRLDILNETVSKFVPRKEATASIMARLGLDEEGYSSALSQAQKDTDEILSMIRGESQGNKLVAENNLTKIATLSKAIGDIAPHLEEKIMKEIGKAINKPISQTGKKQAKEVVGKTKDGVSFKISKGKQKYEETSKQMDAQIEKQRKAEKYKFANDVKQSGTKLEGTAEFMNELSKVQKQLVKAEAKLEGLRASGATAESIAKQEEAVAKLIDDEAEAIAKSDTFAKTASTIGSESLARQKEMYQRMASAMDDIVDDMAEELNTRILDDVIDDDAKEVLSNNLSDDLSEALGTEIKVEVKKQSEKGTVSSEADVDTIKGEELAGVIDEMSSLERTANEKYEPYKSARKMTIFTSLKFGELLKSLSGKIGELPLSFSKAGMVKDGSIYVKHGESGYMFPIAHEIGHLVSHKFNSSDFALIKNEIESIKDYFYKKKAGKEAGDSDRFAYETSTSEIIADMYAVYKSNRAKKLNEIAPNLSSIFSRYEDEVLSEIKPASKLDDATLKEFDDAIPKGATEDDLLINSAYKKGESYGWTLDELSKHIDTERVKTATLDSNGNLVIGGGKAVTRNGDIVNESISAERSYVAVDRMVAKSKKQSDNKSIDDISLQEEMQDINTNSLGGKNPTKVSWWKKPDNFDDEDIPDANKIAKQKMQEGDFGRNYLRSLEQEVNFLYREMDLDRLLEMLRSSGGLGSSSELFFASAKELAIGQGKNSGIMIKIKPNVKGKTNLSKTYIGTGKEYIIKDSFSNIRSNIVEIVTTKEYLLSLPVKEQRKLLSSGEIKFVDSLDEYRGISVSESGNIKVSGKVDLPIENGYVTVGGNKVLAATAIAALGTTGAMADGGESISAYGFGTFLLAAIAGTAFVKTIKDNPSVVTSMLHKGKEAKAVETMAKIESDPIVKERKAWSQKAFDFFKTGYISSYFTVEKHGSDFAKDLVSKLVENPSMFDNVPADVLKNAELKTALGRIHVAEAENFKSFVLESEINTSVLDTVSNLGAETHALENFRLKVSDAIDNPNGTHLKSVTEQAKIYRKELDQAFDAMVANGVYGVDEATRLKNYFPRYIRGSNIVSITSTQEGMDGLINAISLMVKDATGKPQAQADKWADIWVKHATKVYKGSNLSSKEADRFMNAMTEFGIDMKGISKEDIMMAASDSSDVMSRIKSRLPMKMSSFKPFKAMIDGVETTIHAEDIFMRNSNDVVKKYLNESYGQIALKQALGDSYTSESALRAVINEEANQEVRDVLNMYVSALTGKPLYDANTVMNRNIDIAKNLSYGKLLLATVSMTPELIKATASIMMHSDTFSQGVKELKNIFKDIPSNTLLSEELSYSIMGTGTSSAIKEGSFKGIDSFTNINEDVGGLVGRIGNANKSTSLWLSRLIQADDAVKRIASIHNIHRLLDLANNKSTMSQQRMTRYGITPELLATVKNNVKVDSNGNILTIDWNSWKQKDKNMFRAVLHQMNQQRSIEVMIGGIPKASLNNPAGRLLSFLSSFTAQMYSTHFVGMFKSLDQEEMFNQITWMVGGMMTALAKDSISGREKEITDEELVIRTIQSSPAVAPYSLVKLFSDPISLQTGADAIQEVNNLGSIATKD